MNVNCGELRKEILTEERFVLRQNEGLFDFLM